MNTSTRNLSFQLSHYSRNNNYYVFETGYVKTFGRVGVFVSGRQVVSSKFYLLFE